MSEQVRPTRRRPGTGRTVNGRPVLGVAGYGTSGRSLLTGWEPKYRRSVILSDLVATLLVVLTVGSILVSRHAEVSSLELLALESITVAVVMASLAVGRVWNIAVLGQGADEFTRLGRGLFGAVVVLGLGALAMAIPGARLWVFVVVPAIGLLAFPQRYVLRRVLHHRRSEGRCLLPVLAAGNPAMVADLIARSRLASHVGWNVEAVCTPDGRGLMGTDIDDVPVVGQYPDLADHVQRGGYRIVAITPDAYWTPRRLQQLAWDLEGTGTEMVVAPGIMDVAGPRLHVSGVLGMPLLRLSEPTFTGFRRMVKGGVDRAGAALLLLLLAPLIAAVAIAIVVDSRGPVFYTQKRTGKGGRQFTMVKFRTMVTNADALRAQLASANEGAGLLFKMRKDPRVTKVGQLLRRYSIDELPQLFNVVTGDMSLVGPRPPLPEESAKYGPVVRRRLLVKPGLTGLWQVSGRSDLSWEESVRLDLRYVEDWSLALDAVILWKTVRAVLSGEGAY
ncbi:exopolysaccharide biosynthesis polyprenyl glycosylphosphotransferase [Lentzea sp. NBRC 105346]|uniref:sugar transferase n=1 Tax=Lentzea sp. NBRC 105346 TaxID=3032205 RepID=UPI0024A4952F|nr:sugar transferase [Lentzea sp. NBRC 105346]GLZ28906.1 exopolysaccharide biosynthesis polyprenyl glycosylphosphotransferase [Lentzea sp. NBRC 105346]